MRIDRRELLRRGALAGLALPLLPALQGCEGGGGDAAPSASPGSAGGDDAQAAVVRLSVRAPDGPVDPLRSQDAAARALVAITGEYLCLAQGGLLHPWLAESWAPDLEGSVWTFRLRSDVRFTDGSPMTAADVAASLTRLARERPAPARPDQLSTALPRCRIRALDDVTVRFVLEQPDGSFAHRVSSDNPWSVVLPAARPHSYQQTLPGTGPWRYQGAAAGAGLRFDRNPGYWGQPATTPALEVVLSADAPAQISLLRQHRVDVVAQTTVADAATVLDDPGFTVTAVPAAAHAQLSMRCDAAPFADVRARRALALSLPRDDTTHALFQGRADLGNDSPFAPAYAQTAAGPPQREQSLVSARRLLAEAGLADGFAVELAVPRLAELPDFARIVAGAAADIGIAVTPRVMPAERFWGDAVPGRSPWLDAPASLTPYAHAGTPQAALAAALSSPGGWNAARFHDAGYDALVAEYRRALGLPAQRALAAQIERLLLAQTPVVIAYFPNHLTIARVGTSGIRASAAGQVWLDRVLVA